MVRVVPVSLVFFHVYSFIMITVFCFCRCKVGMGHPVRWTSMSASISPVRGASV